MRNTFLFSIFFKNFLKYIYNWETRCKTQYELLYYLHLLCSSLKIAGREMEMLCETGFSSQKSDVRIDRLRWQRIFA